MLAVSPNRNKSPSGLSSDFAGLHSTKVGWEPLLGNLECGSMLEFC